MLDAVLLVLGAIKHALSSERDAADGKAGAARWAAAAAAAAADEAEAEAEAEEPAAPVVSQPASKGSYWA
jgi:hypothetical protein